MPYRVTKSDPNVSLKELMTRISTAMGCGGCANITSVASEHTCITCGRMLCGECGVFCKDHRPQKTK